jgi:hypothetical protein
MFKTLVLIPSIPLPKNLKATLLHGKMSKQSKTEQSQTKPQ